MMKGEPQFFESPSGDLFMLHNPTREKIQFMLHLGCEVITPELYQQKKKQKIGADGATGGYEELEVE